MRWTEEQLADYRRGRTAAKPTPAKPRKYRNVPAKSADDKRFDSKLERDYYEQLLLRWKAGEVLWFIRQPRFDLEGGVVYVADFLVVTVGGVEVVDTTGVMTQAKANKLKQMRSRYGIEVKLVRSV